MFAVGRATSSIALVHTQTRAYLYTYGDGEVRFADTWTGQGSGDVTGLAFGDYDGDGHEELALAFSVDAAFVGKYVNIARVVRQDLEFGEVSYNLEHVLTEDSWGRRYVATGVEFGNFRHDARQSLAVSRRYTGAPSAGDPPFYYEYYQGNDGQTLITPHGEDWWNGQKATDVAFIPQGNGDRDLLAVSRARPAGGTTDVMLEVIDHTGETVDIPGLTDLREDSHVVAFSRFGLDLRTRGAIARVVDRGARGWVWTQVNRRPPDNDDDGKFGCSSAAGFGGLGFGIALFGRRRRKDRGRDVGA